MYLLDTHIVFWALMDSQRLRAHHRALLSQQNVVFFVSAVTGWEIAAKVRLGKWAEAAPLVPGLAAAIDTAGFRQLSLTLDQAEMAGSFDSAHKDPFDRLLAAQAIDRCFTLLTVDPVFSEFGCIVL